jgi:hypothetical protein
MFKNIFASYLLDHGWTEYSPMSYKKLNSDLEIFFDTSNQIEMSKGKINVGSFYLEDLSDLIRVLNNH